MMIIMMMMMMMMTMTMTMTMMMVLKQDCRQPGCWDNEVFLEGQFVACADPWLTQLSWTIPALIKIPPAGVLRGIRR